MVDLILLLIAAICLLLAAISVPVSRISLGWFGLFAFVLMYLIHAIQSF